MASNKECRKRLALKNHGQYQGIWSKRMTENGM